jgi:UDP:flavonoid glycosyltransferase YjiC (YdhE family)
MRFVLTAFGSSGDVHPFIGVGKGLRERGHDVVLLAGEPFRAAATSSGLTFDAIWTTEEYLACTRHPDLWDPRRGLAVVAASITEVTRRVYDEIGRWYEPGRTVLVGHSMAIPTRVFEEVHRAPAATIHLAPSVFRSDYRQPVIAPGIDLTLLPRWMKRGLWRILDKKMLDPLLVPPLNAWRAELGLPPVSRIFKDWLHSPQRVIGLFPDWFGDPQPDWPAQTVLTGFPLYDEADRHEADPVLEDFLASGSPPIVFTPGTAKRQAAEFFEVAVEATLRLRRRALLLSPYEEQMPEKLPPEILHVPYVPFSRVLPRCAAIVHHGGIGTCAQAFAAGIPQLVRPLAFDQFDNAARVRRLGAGSVLRPARFSTDRASDALTALIRGCDFTGCGERTRGRNGVNRTIVALETIGRSKPPLSQLTARSTRSR